MTVFKIFKITLLISSSREVCVNLTQLILHFWVNGNSKSPRTFRRAFFFYTGIFFADQGEFVGSSESLWTCFSKLTLNFDLTLKIDGNLLKIKYLI